MEKERASRTRFAQRAIKPDEIAGELEISDEVLGSLDVVELFVKESCQRLGSPLKKVREGFSINQEQLPKDITNRMNHDVINKMAFDVPCPGASYVSRNHDLTAALAEYVRASHEKLRQTIGHKKVTVEPCLPPDVLAVSVLVPMPTT